MVKTESNKVVKVYLGKSTKPRYFVGQLVPSLRKIYDKRFLLCDGSPHIWTAKQKKQLRPAITSTNFAPDMIGRTTCGTRANNIGAVKESTIPYHSHLVKLTSGDSIKISNPVSTLSIKDKDSYEGFTYLGSKKQGTLNTESGYFGEDITTSKRTYVYWYLFIGE